MVGARSWTHATPDCFSRSTYKRQPVPLIPDPYSSIARPPSLCGSKGGPRGRVAAEMYGAPTLYAVMRTTPNLELRAIRPAGVVDPQEKGRRRLLSIVAIDPHPLK